MRMFLISYDLKIPGRNYDSLYEVLKGALHWWHYLESTWIICTNRTMNDWQSRIFNVLDKNDSFLIIEVTGVDRQGWLPQKAWEWLNEKNLEITKGK